MSRGYLYFPSDENLRRLTSEELDCICVGLANLKCVKLPWGYYENIEDIVFYEDKGMTLDSGVLGHTRFGSKRVILAPLIVDALKWKNMDGIPNNSIAMNTVVHELTHLAQMRWGYGILWAILNAPIICQYTIEKWANENGCKAEEQLQAIYNDLRSKES
jgi:hypothetical protein